VIRINLLSAERERGKHKARVPGGDKLTIACSLILVLAAVLVGWWYWSLKNQSRDLDQQIADAERETARLQSVIVQVQQFEGRRAQLQQRVTLIEELRKGQAGPVHLLDQVSRSMPDTMWLTEMKQNGADVSIDGRCTTLTALSDFVTALENTSYFEHPVEIVDSTVESGAAGTPDLIKFSVKGRFKAPVK
jgi:type IV pilus assembly protein PilN